VVYEVPSKKFTEKLNSRKLALTVLFEGLASVFLFTGLIEADHWVTVTITIGGAYLATQAYVDRPR